MTIPDARIEEKAVASGHVVFWKAQSHKWIKRSAPICKLHVVKSGRLMQNSAVRAEEDTVLLGMRKPNLDRDGNNLPLKVLYLKKRLVNQHALSVMLPQLEQSKDNILTCMMRRSTHSLTSGLAPKASDTLVDYYLKASEATNYHPRVFKHACFATGDLIAWLALTMELLWKSSGDLDLFTIFDRLLHAILPYFDVKLGGVPNTCVGKLTTTVYLPRPFQYVPTGADLAFFFHGNRGNFLELTRDSIVLTRPEGVVDGQKQHAMLLCFDTNANAFDIRRKVCQNGLNFDFREPISIMLENTHLTLSIPREAADEEVQAIGVLKIRRLATELEGSSFLETHRKLLELEFNHSEQ